EVMGACSQILAVATPCGLLNDLIRPPQQRLRNREPEGLRGREVDDQLELGGLLDRQVGGLGALEDLVHVGRGTSLHLGSIYTIGHEATWLDKHPELIDCGHPMRCRKIDDFLSMHEHEGWRRHHYTLVVILLHAEEGGSQIFPSARDERMNLHAETPSRDRGLFTVLGGHEGEYRGREILAKKRDL